MALGNTRTGRVGQVWYDEVRRGWVWFGRAGKVRRGTARFGVVRQARWGKDRFGLVRLMRQARQGSVRFDEFRCGEAGNL